MKKYIIGTLLFIGIAIITLFYYEGVGHQDDGIVVSSGHPCKLFFVKKGDDGKSGIPLGCNDSLVSVDSNIHSSTPEEQIKEIVAKLFSVKAEQLDPMLYNSLSVVGFKIDHINFDWNSNVVAVYLTGQLSDHSDYCDMARIDDQIGYSIKQFGDIDAVVVYVNGVELEEFFEEIE